MATAKKKVVVDTKTPATKNEKTGNGKIEMVTIFSTSYGYYRYWIREILSMGGISKFRFIKDTGSYNGKIAVAKSDVEKAKKVLGEYQNKNPEIKTMWN